ncbi:MAG: zinc-binding dehydrogenase [Candidatus Nanopelagicales bacterium]
MTRAIVNDGGQIRLVDLEAVPGGSALDPVEVALVTADVQPKDRQTARGEMRLPLAPFFVAGSQAVGQLDDGSLVFVRGSIDAAGGLRDGVYAERFVAERDWLLPLPDGLDPVAAAAGTAVLADALYALDDLARLAPGETVLVLGSSSGVGAAAVSVALARGHRVVAATRDPSSVAPREGLVVAAYDDLPATVRAATDGRGADVTVDNVGGALTSLGLRSAARRGRHVLVGYLAGRALELTTMDLIPTEVALIGVNSGSVPRERQRELTAESLALLASRAHTPPSVTPLPLEQGVRALLEDAPGRTVLLGAAYSCLDQVG